MFQIVFALGQKWPKENICQSNCYMCVQSCEDAKRYTKGDINIYASGFRIVNILSTFTQQKTTAAKAANVIVPDAVKRVVSLLVRLVEKAELNQMLEWQDLSDLVELLQFVPDFVFYSIQSKYLEPQGIQIVRTKHTTSWDWLQSLLNKT